MRKSFDPTAFGLTGLSGPAWRRAVATIGEDQGFAEQLGAAHHAAFLDQGDVLLVSFESEEAIQNLSPDNVPLSFEIAQRSGWSTLTVFCRGNTWFRDEAVYDFFDNLRDDGFFGEFERVVFFGAGPGGYAAGAFSDACPGARVLMVQPQATLAPSHASWDGRFSEMRRLDFSSRYGYAPQMISAAKAGHVIYDPRVRPDAMHAALFAAPNVQMLHMPFMGETLIRDLVLLKALPYLLHSVASDQLTQLNFAKLRRLRRKYVPYLRRLLAHLEQTHRYGLAAALCRQQIAERDAPFFQRRLQIAQRQMHAQAAE